MMKIHSFSNKRLSGVLLIRITAIMTIPLSSPNKIIETETLTSYKKIYLW